MRNLESSLINPAAIVINAPATAVKQQSLKEEVLDFKSEVDYMYYISHKVNNVKQKDGRIFLKMVDGILHANSVSPYSDKFEENIEDGIKPLVLALKKKRYLTYSSCMGHGPSFRRYIGLAFADEETRDYVANEIKSLKILGVKTKNMNTVSNMKVTKNTRTNKPEFEKYREEERQREISQEKEVTTFNIQFHRNYEQYFFMEIIILDVINYEYEGILKEVQKLFWRFVKVFYWDKLTKKVEKYVQSDKFKKYLY